MQAYIFIVYGSSNTQPRSTKYPHGLGARRSLLEATQLAAAGPIFLRDSATIVPAMTTTNRSRMQICSQLLLVVAIITMTLGFIAVGGGLAREQHPAKSWAFRQGGIRKHVGNASSSQSPHPVDISPSPSSPVPSSAPAPAAVQLPAKWVPVGADPSESKSAAFSAAFRALALPKSDSSHGNTSDIDLVLHLCPDLAKGAPRWPINLKTGHLSVGRLFVGSTTNWRGLHAAGICKIFMGHAGVLPASAWASNGAADLGAHTLLSNMAGLGEAARQAAGMPASWAVKDAQGYMQVQREYSYIVVVRDAVVSPFGAVLSSDVVLSGAGCQDMYQTLCRSKDFPAFTDLRAAVKTSLASQSNSFADAFQDALQRRGVSAGSSVTRAAAAGRQRKTPVIVVPLNTYWSEGYYHWIFEVLPRLWAAVPLLESLPSAKVVLRQGQLRYAFVRESLDILGISHSRVVESSAYMAADWVLVPPGSSCGQQFPVAEMVTFASFTLAASLRRAAQPGGSAATKPNHSAQILSRGVVSDSSAFQQLVSAAAVHSATVARDLHLTVDAFQGGLPVRTPNATGTVQDMYRMSKTASSSVPRVPLSTDVKRAGPAFSDAVCDQQLLFDVVYRQSVGMRMQGSDVQRIKRSVDWEGAAKVAALDSVCATRAVGGHRLVLLVKRTKRRWIANHSDVKKWLSTRLQGNVTVVEVNTGSMLRQAVLFRCADLVVSPHGAGLSALMFAREGTRVVEVLPGHGDSPSTYLQAATMRNLIYVPLLADNKADQMQISWSRLESALRRVGEVV